MRCFKDNSYAGFKTILTKYSDDFCAGFKTILTKYSDDFCAGFKTILTKYSDDFCAGFKTILTKFSWRKLQKSCLYNSHGFSHAASTGFFDKGFIEKNMREWIHHATAFSTISLGKESKCSMTMGGWCRQECWRRVIEILPAYAPQPGGATSSSNNISSLLSIWERSFCMFFQCCGWSIFFIRIWWAMTLANSNLL